MPSELDATISSLEKSVLARGNALADLKERDDRDFAAHMEKHPQDHPSFKKTVQTIAKTFDGVPGPIVTKTRATLAAIYWHLSCLISAANDRRRELELRVAQLEARPEFADKGVWREGVYHEGHGVTHHGSFWIAQRATMAKPGDGQDWRLAVKRGRDGKDAKS